MDKLKRFVLLLKNINCAQKKLQKFWYFKRKIYKHWQTVTEKVVYDPHRRQQPLLEHANRLFK